MDHEHRHCPACGRETLHRVVRDGQGQVRASICTEHRSDGADRKGSAHLSRIEFQSLEPGTTLLYEDRGEPGSLSRVTVVDRRVMEAGAVVISVELQTGELRYPSEQTLYWP